MNLGSLCAGTTGSRAVGAARIAVGTAALLKLAILAPILLALRDPSVLRLPVASWLPPLPPGAVPILIGVWLVAGCAFTIGWRTRWAGVVLCLALVCALFGDQQLYSNHLYLLLTVTGLLTLADSGAARSLDARRTGGKRRIPAWPVTLLKVQVSIVYGFAALAKLNLPYLSGAVLNAYVGRDSILPFPEAARSFEILAALAWLSILVEAFLAVAFWSRRWRVAAIAVGVIFHLGVIVFFATPAELVVFALIMFALYPLYFADDDGRDLPLNRGS